MVNAKPMQQTWEKNIGCKLDIYINGQNVVPRGLGNRLIISGPLMASETYMNVAEPVVCKLQKCSATFCIPNCKAEVREDKESRQINPKSLSDEEFEDFQSDIPQSGKSTNVQIPIDVSSRDEADIEKSLVVNVGTNQPNQTSQSKNVKTVELENHSDNRLTFQVETKSGEDEGNKQDRSDIKEKEERQSTQEWEDDFEDDEVKATASKGACEDVEEKVVPHLESQTLSTQSSQVKLEQPKPDTETDVANATGKHAMSADEYEEAFEESRRALQGSRTETEIEDADIMEIPEVEAASEWDSE